MFRNFSSIVTNAIEGFSYLIFAFKHFRNPLIIFPVLLHSSQKRNYTIHLREGFHVLLRPSYRVPVCDLNILKENLGQDQYQLKKLIKKGDIIVDIGAHVGIFSIMAAKFSPYGQVIAFEPERSNYQLLQKNISINNGLNVQAYNKAVTSKKNRVLLHLSTNNSGAHTLLGNSSNFQEVETITLTEILDTLGDRNINLLKIDCEGGEYDILLNINGNSFKRIDQIIMEVHETNYTGNYKPELIYEHLKENGFLLKTLKTIVLPGEGVFHIVYASRHEMLA